MMDWMCKLAFFLFYLMAVSVASINVCSIGSAVRRPVVLDFLFSLKKKMKFFVCKNAAYVIPPSRMDGEEKPSGRRCPKIGMPVLVY